MWLMSRETAWAWMANRDRLRDAGLGHDRLMDDRVTRKRLQQRARTRRFRRRQRQGQILVQVTVSERFLSYLVEIGALTEAEAMAADRSANGPIARKLAALAEDAVSKWEQAEGRISSG
jgi:hypothetical protein